MHFADRFIAGQELAQRLRDYEGRADTLVLALPRGGVPVAYEVAKALDAPLDVFLVRKLGVPGHEELAMGAVADGRLIVLNDEVVGPLAIPRELIDEAVEREYDRIQQQRKLYRDGAAPPQVKDRVVILVDDGLATGSTMRAAVAALRRQAPRRLIVAVPVGAAETCAALRDEVDEVVCAVAPRHLTAVGVWYEDFSPTSDSTVRTLLAESSHCQHA